MNTRTTTRRARFRVVGAVALASALVLSACGNGDDTTDAPDDTTDDATEEEAETDGGTEEDADAARGSSW